MQKNGLSAYADHTYTQIGKPLDAVYPLASPQQCTGRVESTATVAGSGPAQAIRIAGWVWDREKQRPPSAIVITEDETITGLGVVGEWRPMTQVDNRRIKDGYLGFAGYARVVRQGVPLKLYAILHGKPQSACYFATAESLERP
jgi:hypothetical protein